MMTRRDELRKMVAEATPGPWAVPGQPDKVCAEGFTAKGAAKTVATAVSPAWMRLAEPAANARLIAQAATLAMDLANALDRIAALVEALEFYALEGNYEGFSATDPCGCCSSWYEPKIHSTEDNGIIARAALSAMGITQGEG